MKSYQAICQRYIDGVLSGAIPNGKWAIKAIKRHVDDLKTFSTGETYYFDQNEADKVCQFVELCPHVKGQLRGQRIQLQPWQVAILSIAFGWRRSADGGRRFRHVYIEVPRGNGKSCLSSTIALYSMLCEKEPGAEVYSFATTRDQAGIVFKDAQQMVRLSPDMQRAFGVEVTAHAIVVQKMGSTFQAKSSEASTLDGLNTHFACVDELHAHHTRELYDVVETSMGKRKNPLMWCITTAGFNTSGICYEVRTIATKVLDRELINETLFAIIFHIDEHDDWTTEAAAQKANPNYGVSVMPEHIRSMVTKAKAIPSMQNNLKTKHFNVWCSAGSSWIDIDVWKQGTTAKTLMDFVGKPCYIGLDLSSKNDLTAVAIMFIDRQPNGQHHYYFFNQYYLPKKTIDRSTNAQYGTWVDQGVIKATLGGVVDYEVIREDLINLADDFDVQAIAYDRWNAETLVEELSDSGFNMIQVDQGIRDISSPAKLFEALVIDGRVHHPGDDCTTWQVGNAVIWRDVNDNIKPKKERYENKIDAVIAMIMALGVSSPREEEPTMDFDAFVNNIACF